MNAHRTCSRQRLHRGAIILILAAAVAACGQMGPLYQPTPEPSQDSLQPSGADDQ